MIKQRNGVTIVRCDACLARTHEAPGTTRWAAIAARKEAVSKGWMARHGNTWCPVCSAGVRAKQLELDLGLASNQPGPGAGAQGADE